MAALIGHWDFRNWRGDSIWPQVWLGAGNSKTVSLIVAISVLILSPIIVSGNLFLHLERTLWRSSGNGHHIIILSMVVVDFMVGFVTSILTAYWCWAVYQTKKPVFGPVRFSITFLNISVKRLCFWNTQHYWSLYVMFS